METQTINNTFFSLFKEAEKDSKYYAEGLKIEIAELIYNAMEKKGINQTRLAELLDVNRAYMSRILKGNVNLTIETLAKIGKGLDSEWKIKLNEIEANAIPKNYDASWTNQQTRIFNMTTTAPSLEDDYLKEG